MASANVSYQLKCIFSTTLSKLSATLQEKNHALKCHALPIQTAPDLTLPGRGHAVLLFASFPPQCNSHKRRNHPT